MEDGDGFGKVMVPLVTFPLSGLPGVLYVLESGQVNPIKHINMCTRRGLIIRIARTAPRRGGLSNHGLLLWKRLSKHSGL